MHQQSAGTIAELWRYPVKSMLGEQRTQLAITPRGSLGDRAKALRDLNTGRIASAKKFPRLLDFHARYEVEPTCDAPGLIEITTPAGRTVCADDPEASTIISDELGHPVRLQTEPGSQEITEIIRETVFGDVPVNKFKPDWTPETMPDHFKLMKESFFEIGAIFVVTSGSVDYLRKLQGEPSKIDRRRFRPNIYIESGPAWSGFVEDSWIGGSLEIGGTVTIQEFQPTIWCVTSTLAQEDLPRDLSILRTIANHHKGCFGAYATVSKPGLVHVEDPVILLTEELSAAASA
ncbi:MAG: MOSC N-terminal beta barrel domain-containing protein [Candidatus Acidiferrum sp.]